MVTAWSQKKGFLARKQMTFLQQETDYIPTERASGHAKN